MTRETRDDCGHPVAGTVAGATAARMLDIGVLPFSTTARIAGVSPHRERNTARL
jgi:hypothetical protein